MFLYFLLASGLGRRRLAQILDMADEISFASCREFLISSRRWHLHFPGLLTDITFLKGANWPENQRSKDTQESSQDLPKQRDYPSARQEELAKLINLIQIVLTLDQIRFPLLIVYEIEYHNQIHICFDKRKETNSNDLMDVSVDPKGFDIVCFDQSILEFFKFLTVPSFFSVRNLRTNTFNIQVNRWTHNFIPPIDHPDQQSRVLESACPTDWMGKFCIWSEICLDGVTLDRGFSLSQRANNVGYLPFCIDR